jgi:MYXO-CTERM domain-containing protein
VAADEYQPGTQPRTIPPDMLGPNDNQLPVNQVRETANAWTQYNDARYGNGNPDGGLATFGGVQLERASYCLGCHLTSVPESPGRTWEGSMMANAARDPLMYAALAIANQDVSGVGGDFCLRCHSPSGFTMGHTMMNPPAVFNGRAVPGATASDPNNPNHYPCREYEPGSMTLCRCLDEVSTAQRTATFCQPGSGFEADRDFCTETPNRVANGYCMINFGDNTTPNFRGHPDNAEFYHDEVYEQLYSGQLFLDVGPEDSNGAADPADDTEGLQCAFCHRLDPSANGMTRMFGGNYYLSTATTWPVDSTNRAWAAPRTVRFGPYSQSYTDCTDPNNPATCNMTTGTAHRHPVSYSPLHQSSNLCGICHDVTNPSLYRLNSDGSTRNDPITQQPYLMPVERTFSEWAASDYRTSGPRATQCQGCHMPQAMQPTPACLALGGQSYNRPSPGADTQANPGYGQHIFAGGNVWLPSAFRDIVQPIAGVGDPLWLYSLVTIPDNILGNVQREQVQAYDFTAQAAQAMLQSAATLSLNGAAPRQTRSGGSISFSVRVTNNAGHKLPTGYPEGRRMWLLVQASVPSDPSMPPPFFESGAWDLGSGVLTRDTQLKIYEVALGRRGAAMEPYPTQFHFVTNQIVFQDNRIPPAGFDMNNPAFDQMAPVPSSLYPPATPGGTTLRNWDDSSYTIPVPALATGDVRVTVSLLYQTASKDYIDFLRTANTTNGRGEDITTVWNNHGRSTPVVMATQSFTVANTAPYVPPADMGTLDMAVPLPPWDMIITPDPPKPQHGCGVSVAGADWSDLGPLATLLVAGFLLSRRRRSR